MSMLDIYRGKQNANIKCRLLKPIYQDKKVIDYAITDKFCFCKDSQFITQFTMQNNRRFKEKTGNLTTYNLEQDEIDIDWRIKVDGKVFIIDEIIQEDEDIQQENLSSGLVKTIMKVRC